jgi:two-component system nitrogen regulation response regulator GlnG
VPVDSGAIPETLFEAELFGHEKGAFTGATGRKPGRFEQANRGTLFLDEILNMPLTAQAKVLRALQEKSFCRVGGTQPIKIDVRVLAAGNEDLDAAVAAGRLRADLFYRLNEFTLRIPPLRQRKEDLLYLAKRFLDLTNQELKKAVAGFSEPAIQALLNYPWPGNVRQLRSTIRRAVLLAGDVVTEHHLDILQGNSEASQRMASPVKAQVASATELSLKAIVAQSRTVVEREVLLQTLRQTGGNKAKAARLLQVDYKTIQSKIKHYGISPGKETL